MIVHSTATPTTKILIPKTWTEWIVVVHRHTCTYIQTDTMGNTLRWSKVWWTCKENVTTWKGTWVITRGGEQWPWVITAWKGTVGHYYMEGNSGSLLHGREQWVITHGGKQWVITTWRNYEKWNFHCPYQWLYVSVQDLLDFTAIIKLSRKLTVWYG